MVGRGSHRCTVLAVLVSAFALRALTPDGYMPATAGSGLLFELCPDGLPVAVVQRLAGGGHHHHHGAGGAEAAADDRCPIGHMLTSAIAAGELAIAVLSPIVPEFIATATPAVITRGLVSYRSRAPPA